MNTKSYQAQLTSTAASFSTIQVLRLAVMLAVMAGFSGAQAAVIVKTNNVSNLNLAASWTNNAVPGSADIAQWDSTVSDVNNTTNTLGANLSLAGVKVLNPAANIVIVTNAGGNNLTLGTSGIDLSTASQSLTLSNATTLLGANAQSWKVNLGGSVLVGGPLTRGGQATVDFDNSAGGTITIASGTASSALNYTTVNKTDFGALDASKNVVGAASVLTYTPNTVSSGANTANMGAGPYQVIDVVNSNPANGPSGFRLTASASVSTGIRFNTPNANNIDWVIDPNSRNLNFAGACVLITPNVGAHNVIEQDSATGFRFSSGQEMIVAQHNTSGDFILNGHISASSGTVNVTKTGAGRFIINVVGGNNIGLLVEQGTVLVNGTIPSGSTVNNGGTLGGAGTVASVTVANGGSLAPGNNGTNATGALTLNGSLTLNAGTTSVAFYSPSVPITNTTGLLLVTNGLLTVNGTVNVSIISGKPAVGQYPLIKWTNSIPAPTFANFVLAGMPLQTTGYLSNNATAFTIDLVITNIAEPLSWATSSGTWNTNGGSIWKDPQGNLATYQEANGVGDSVLFQDALSGGSPLTVTLNSALFPASTTVSNSTKSYTISGTGSIGGFGSLTKAGVGTLTLATANSFSGGLALNGGTANFSALTNLGGGAISFGGGTLQYNGNSDDISVQTVTLNAGGGTIDTAGNTVNFANPVSSSSTGGLTKVGAGTLTLNGTNRYTGNTVVANGTLALGGNTFISNSPAIIVNSGAILDASGPGLTLRGAPVQTLAGSGTINGTIVSSNGIITPGTNGVVGTLTFANDLTLAGGTVVIDLATNTSQRDLIEIGGNPFIAAGTVQLNVTGTLTNGVYKLIHYAGGLGSGAGSSASLVLSGYTQVGKILALSDTVNPNEIDLVVSTQGGANTVWQGNDPGSPSNWDIETTPNFVNGISPVAFVQGDKPTFDDTSSNPNVNLMAALQPGSVTVTANVNNYVFSDGTGTGAGKLAGSGGITKNGSSTLTIATANLNSGPTVINGGIVQVGDGGIVGDLGFGNVTNNGALVFNLGDNHSVSGAISGTGPLTKQGGGIVTLSANNTYSGPTIITSGSLQVGSGGATGSLGSGAITNDGTLIYNRSGSLSVGNIKTGPANQGALTFSGSASYTLNGGNTYINNTAVNGGVVKLAAAENIPSGATVPSSTGWLVLDGGAASAGVLDLNGFNQTVNALSGLGSTVNGVITNTGASAATTNIITVLGTTGTTYSGGINDSATGSKIGLTLLGTSELRLAGNCNYSGPTLVASGATLGVAPGYLAGPGLTVLSNGATFYLDSSSPSVSAANAIFIPDNSVGIIRSRSTGNTMGNAATISGGVTATNLVVGNIVSSATQNISFNAPATKQFQSFLGTVLITNTETIRFSSTTLGTNGGDNTTFEVDAGAFINTRNGTGNGAASGIYLGALTGAGTISGGGVTVSSVTTYVIGGKGINSDFSGTVSDGGAGNTALVKTGAGTLTLDGTLSYTGNTTVNQGTLQIASAGGSTSLDTSRTITITSNAVLDVSARSDSTLNLGNSITQTFAGHGTIRGSLFEAATTTNNLTLGVMNITNVATINGALNMQINRTNAANCSQLAAASFVNGGSITLTVANVGPTNLVAGDTFQLFNQPFPGAFVVTNLPVLPAPQMYWTNKIALNGSIAVASTVNTSPTNITVSVSGSTLTLSWPADHIGWTLQAQTNNVSVGLGTNWVNVPGSTSVNSVIVTIDPTKPTVFYRMTY